MKYCAPIVALLAACGGDDTTALPDAGPRPDAAFVCPPQSPPLEAGMHQLYLAYAGATLTLGDCDDSRTNCTSLVSQATTTVPAFDAARVASITAMVQDALAPFSVNIVTTRPTTGDYRMIVVGGTSDAVIGMADQLLAVKPVCEPTNKNSIALVFIDADAPEERTDRAYADTIAGAFGRLVGLVPTTRAGDCMCTQSTCQHTQACTWAAEAAAQAGNTCMRTSQNEQQFLMDAVGCR